VEIKPEQRIMVYRKEREKEKGEIGGRGVGGGKGKRKNGRFRKKETIFLGRKGRNGGGLRGMFKHIHEAKSTKYENQYIGEGRKSSKNG